MAEPVAIDEASIPLEDEELSLQDAKGMIDNVGTRHKSDHSSGDVLYEMYDSMERFTAERIILISKKLELDEELIMKILQTNSQYARHTSRRIGSKKKRKEVVTQSLVASGLYY